MNNTKNNTDNEIINAENLNKESEELLNYLESRDLRTCDILFLLHNVRENLFIQLMDKYTNKNYIMTERKK
jgi:hypothetical protein